MRAAFVPLLLGIAVACSGKPFTASANSEPDGPSRNAENGGNQPGPSTTTPEGNVTDTESRGGANATSGQQTSPDGMGGAFGGAPEEGEGGEGGEGGAPATPQCPSAAANDWELGYFPELRDATTIESHPFFQVTNRGKATSLDRIVIRYYFTKESTAAETAACYWVTGDRCSLAKLEFGDMLVPTSNASRYLQVSFPSASKVMVAAGSLEVRVGFKTGSAPELQTNDYSFDSNALPASSATPFPYKRWLKATLYLDGQLVWGTEPCAANR